MWDKKTLYMCVETIKFDLLVIPTLTLIHTNPYINIYESIWQ